MLLLPGGHTAHSRFRIPLEIDERSICNIHRGIMLGNLIKKTPLILWDEPPMTHCTCFESLDRTLRGLLSETEPAMTMLPFGGMPIVLGGDFQQVLSVINGGCQSDVVLTSLTKSPIWRHIRLITLRTNMRLSNPLLSENEKQELAFCGMGSCNWKCGCAYKSKGK